MTPGDEVGWLPPGDGLLTPEQVDLVLAWNGDARADARWVARAVSEEEIAWATGAVLVAVRALINEGTAPAVEVVRPHVDAAHEVLAWLIRQERATDVGRRTVW